MKRGNSGLSKIIKKMGTLDFGGNPSPLVDLIHQFFKKFPYCVCDFPTVHCMHWISFGKTSIWEKVQVNRKTNTLSAQTHSPQMSYLIVKVWRRRKQEHIVSSEPTVSDWAIDVLSRVSKFGIFWTRRYGGLWPATSSSCKWLAGSLCLLPIGGN